VKKSKAVMLMGFVFSVGTMNGSTTEGHYHDAPIELADVQKQNLSQVSSQRKSSKKQNRSPKKFSASQKKATPEEIELSEFTIDNKAITERLTANHAKFTALAYESWECDEYESKVETHLKDWEAFSIALPTVYSMVFGNSLSPHHVASWKSDLRRRQQLVAVELDAINDAANVLKLVANVETLNKKVSAGGKKVAQLSDKVDALATDSQELKSLLEKKDGPIGGLNSGVASLQSGVNKVQGAVAQVGETMAHVRTDLQQTSQNVVHVKNGVDTLIKVQLSSGGAYSLNVNVESPTPRA
jgi:chromosome segregation ATPase